MSPQPVVLRVMDDAQLRLGELGCNAQANALIEARSDVGGLIAAADTVSATLEMPTLARQYTTNADAGFIDWRDWCALKSEVATLRAALARCKGGTP